MAGAWAGWAALGVGAAWGVEACGVCEFVSVVAAAAGRERERERVIDGAPGRPRRSSV